MLRPKRISRCARAYHLSLPKRWCQRVGIAAGAAVVIRGEIEGRALTWERRAVGCARGLHVALPPDWRRAEGLTWGDPVLLLEEEPAGLRLQVIEGLSEKELSRRGQVVALLRITQAREDLQAAREASYAQGLFAGHTQGYVQGLRSRQEPARSPEEPEP